MEIAVGSTSDHGRRYLHQDLPGNMFGASRIMYSPRRGNESVL
jgi:hypothetical protein